MSDSDALRVDVPRTALSIPAAKAWFERYGTVAFSPRSSGVIVTPNRPAYAHQNVAALQATMRGCLLLGDEPGLGKSTSSLLAAETARRDTGRPVLIVGPRSVRDVWRDELLALGFITRDEEFLALEGKHGDPKRLGVAIEGVRYIFVHFEIVAAWWPWISMCRTCVTIIDEAHLVKNSRSLRGKAAALVTSAAPVRILLTGTPILNRIGELHHLLTLTTGPWTWGGATAFRARYAGAYNDGYGLVDTAPTNTEELQARLSQVYIRRTLKDTGVELPEITRQVIRVDFEDRDRDKYKDALGGRSPRDIMQALMGRMGSIATIGWLTALRKITSRAKLAATTERVDNLLEQGEDVVVFTWERAMAARIAGALKNAPSMIIHGDIPQSARRLALQVFSAPREQPRALVATYGALSVGVTLTRARHVVMHDLDYVPATMIQAEKRVHRISQTRSTHSLWMTAKGSIDDMITKLVIKKADAIAKAMRDDEPMSLAEVLGDRAEDEVEETLEAALAWATGGR